MIYIETGSTDPYFNLAVEEYVFENLDKTNEYFMLWQNSASVIIGRYQNASEEVDRQYVEKNKIPVVRRLTGGGTVYHDIGNLNFTFIKNIDSGHAPDFKLFANPIVSALNDFGVNAKCTGRNDITINDMKIAGNAQYLKNGRLLHHGCLMLNTELTTLSNVLTPKPAKFISKATKSVKSRVTTVNNHINPPITMEQLKNNIKLHIFENQKINEYQFSDNQYKEISQLCEGKYKSWKWNYSTTPDFTMKREKKFPCGMVEVYLQVTQGVISNIKFYGDFFGGENIEEFEEMLKGYPIDENLENILKQNNMKSYLYGFTYEDIANLIR